MPAEDHKQMKKVQCWIPLETWDKLVSLGYDSPTIAVTKAFEKLLEDPREDPRINPLVSLKDPLVSPDIPVYQARIEGLEMILREKDKSIERLEREVYRLDEEVNRLDMFAHYFKSLEHKQLPGSTEEVRPAQKESRYREKEERLFDVVQDESPAIKESPDIEPVVKPKVNKGVQPKNTFEMQCLECGETFQAQRKTRLFCSKRCEARHRRGKENMEE